MALLYICHLQTSYTTHFKDYEGSNFEQQNLCTRKENQSEVSMIVRKIFNLA